MPKGVYLRTEEHRRKNRDGHLTAEYREKAIRARGRRADGKPAQGSWENSRGYIILAGQQGHPLADANGGVAEHRKVLYDNIGAGPHPCYWNCGRMVEWGSRIRSVVLCVDHLDDDKLNNDPANLVPSCFKCNWDRGDPRHRARIENQR